MTTKRRRGEALRFLAKNVAVQGASLDPGAHVCPTCNLVRHNDRQVWKLKQGLMSVANKLERLADDMDRLEEATAQNQVAK